MDLLISAFRFKLWGRDY